MHVGVFRNSILMHIGVFRDNIPIDFLMHIGVFRNDISMHIGDSEMTLLIWG
jgi:hypothetical protein